MWKILLCDDEAVIVKGLSRLIDWESLRCRVVGEATDGTSAAQMIERLRPDLVVSDIRMPGLTGLELMERCRGGKNAPKFIFVSGYEEFEYARQAISGGAVDYLLKPVSAAALEGAVRKAMGMLEDSTAAEVFRQPEGGLQEFFGRLTADRPFAGSELSREFNALLGGRADSVFAGLCFGLPAGEEERLRELPYERRLLQRFMAFNAVRDQIERGGHGCFLRKDEVRCCLMGVFAPDERIEDVIRAALDDAAEKTGYRLMVGVGGARGDVEQITATYEESLRAFDRYYFEECNILFYRDLPPRPNVTNDCFDKAAKKVFQDIVAKSDRVLDDIDALLDVIADLHYGNRVAAFNRTMLFTGDLCQQLFINHLLTGSFTQRQDALQQTLEACPTFAALRRALRGYYEGLLPDVYCAARSKNTAEIYRVQQYIQEHFAQDISLKTLAEVACVSPNYFSAYFKAETGQNYKAYLTQVRMERAMHLVISTSLKTYEIAEQVGYNNVRRFVDAFRAYYEMSPMDYRRQQK